MTSEFSILMNNIQGTAEGSSVSYNISLGNDTDDISDASDSSSVTKNLIIPSAMFSLGVLGNVIALIILTVRPSKNSKATAFYHLVKALVCMDLFGIVASSPVTIVVYLRHGVFKTGGMPLCHYFSFILVMAGNATVFTVLVMAAERYMVTKYPFKYSSVVKPLTVNCCIAAVWGLSAFIALLPIFGMGRNIQPWPGTWCFFDYRSTTLGGHIFSYFYAACGLLAILITIILNVTVIRHLWHMRKNRLSSSSLRASEHFSPSRESQGPDSEKRMVIFLMAIIIVFTVCYAPLMVRIIMNQMLNAGAQLKPGHIDDTMDLWALRLACLNQILDPWVYIISLVTCCKGTSDRDRGSLSHSLRSYNTAGFTNGKDKLLTCDPQHGKTRRAKITQTWENVRHFFSGKHFTHRQKEAVTIPLQPSLTHKTLKSSLETGSQNNKLEEEAEEHTFCNGGSYKDENVVC